MDYTALKDFVDAQWQDSIVDELKAFIRIPAKSPDFDPDWASNGHLDAAVAHAERWCRDTAPASATVEVIRLPGRTPLLLIDVPGTADGTVLLYGHLDKQPEVTGWSDGYGPWTPVYTNDRLYGRGSADDGYAVYASVAAIRAVHEQGAPHARCIVLIETCEESGSYDLPHYIEHLRDRIGQPDLVLCLDSGCGNYEQMWCTTSLRGMAAGTLTVETLTQGVHSGDAGGVVPSSFRVARHLLERLEDSVDGRIVPGHFNATIPDERRVQAREAAMVIGATLRDRFPFADGVLPEEENLAELVLNRSWRPALEITGADGLPPIADAGNVLRPYTAMKLALRLPPTVAGEDATQRLKALLESNPPNNAKVTFTPEQASSGWHAPPLSDWLADTMEAASEDTFGAPVMYMGEGGTIPLMALLSDAFPQAQFVITGVLGPQSNAHGPDEFLHVPTARNLTTCVARIIAAHAQNR
ncbi:M20 family metallopeptidase [Aquisalimonas asiatica]|uniref:Acetylornithine deacetylase/Succinyl-diaminopimelate desuccinylase n=1 Tax=Aquisalimonas asiatica TaxID=406100 RepID=A0A1H8Q6A0_9GAMM|nr:M20 family metallopeptidase [Aquisalimonas asiatica]SEO49596.1 Acetylornithine deacetylase/Succinyl-diaminopimelate desuccinylase [Aquisalimonas asiatica]